MAKALKRPGLTLSAVTLVGANLVPVAGVLFLIPFFCVHYGGFLAVHGVFVIGYSIVCWVGIEPWPKLFQSLRSTRETELTEEYPLHVACAWIGNSRPVAAKHYLQVTEGHFEQAVQKAVQNAVQQVSAPSRTEPHRENGLERKSLTCEDLREDATARGNVRSHRDGQMVTPTGLEPVSRP